MTTVTDGIVLQGGVNLFREYIPWVKRSDIWTIYHNLDCEYIYFHMHDDRYGGVIKDESIENVTIVDNNTLQIKFYEECWGKIIIDGNVNMYNLSEENKNTYWEISHDLNYKYVNVLFFDNNNQKVLSDNIADISYDTDNVLAVTFNSLFYGTAVINKDIIEYIIPENEISDVWIVEHNLGIKYVSVRCYDARSGEILDTTYDINYIDDSKLSVQFKSSHYGTLQIYPHEYVDSTGRGRWAVMPDTELVMRETTSKGYMSLIDGGGSYDSEEGQRHVNDIHKLGRPQTCLCAVPHLLKQLKLARGDQKTAIFERLQECIDDDDMLEDIENRYGPF